MEETCPEQIYLGKVTQVIDPSNFWMQIGTDESLAEFLQFEINLEDSCHTMGVSVESVDDIGMGQLVLVDCTDSERMWRRGQVSRVDRDSEAVDVLYIDYGDTELVNIDRLCVNQEDFFSYPSQALRCSLAGIIPIAKTWTSRASKMFQDMVSNEIFQTVVLAYQPGSFKVSLYTNHGDDGVAVAYMMLEQELGLPSDDDVPRLFADAPKHCNPDTSYSSGDYSIWGTPVMPEERNEEGAWPDSAPDQSSSSDSPPSACYITPQTGDNTDEDSAPKIQSHNSGDDEDNDIAEESQTPGERIPEFDFTQIEKYWDMSSDKLHEKVKIKRHIQLEAENMKLQEDMKEQSALTAAAGSGRFSILNYSSDEEGDTSVYKGKFVDSKFIDDVYDTNTNNVQDEIDRQDKENKPPPIVVEGKKKKFEKYEIPPRLQKKTADKSPKKNNRPTPPPGFSERNEEVYPNALEYTAVHWSGTVDQGMLAPGEKLTSYKDASSHKQNPAARLNLGVSEPVNAPWVEDVVVVGNQDGETVHMDQITALEQTSPTKVDFYRVVNQILAGTDKEDYDVTAAKLRRLFSTDLFVYLDTEQLQAVINILLIRAVRYYGELHDCLLEIIELLNVAQDFPECIVNGIKKLHDMYITVTTMGKKSLYVQCSKIFGHLFNLSLFWNDSAICVQKCILDLVERWMYFNKKGTQTGQEELEQIYLDSFKTIWVIIADVLKDKFVERYDNIQWECRDKLFGANIPRATKEQLLDLYINCFVVPSEKFTVAMGCQTDACEHRRHRGVQTDPQQTASTESQHTAFQPTIGNPSALRHQPRDHSIPLMTPSSFSSASTTGESSVSGVVSPAFASKGVASPERFSSPVRFTSPYHSSSHTPRSHTSPDSSAYFTPEQSPFSREFPPLVNSADGEDAGKQTVNTSWVEHVTSAPDVQNSTKKDSSKNRKSISSPIETNTSNQNRQSSPSDTTVRRKTDTTSPKPSGHQTTQQAVPSSRKEEKTQKTEIKQQGLAKEDSTKPKRKDGHHKKGSFPLMRYGLATSVKDAPHEADQGDSIEDRSTAVKSVEKKLDMNSIMMDLMNSSDNARPKCGVTNETKVKESQEKKKDKKSTNKPIDWWSMDVDGADDGCEGDSLDLGWSAKEAKNGEAEWSLNEDKHGEVLLRDVKSPVTASAGKSDNSAVEEDDGDLEWETDNSDEEDDQELVASILRADSRRPIQQEQRTWQPGVRKCTACGDESHTIYDCPNKHKNAFF
ncbi:uncharacterized protein [Argopecten irradians]|uniref:uncharacterized protein n=1 Tax=Argopecten irradians TaxID=31199 RepID=UPI00370F89FD